MEYNMENENTGSLVTDLNGNVIDIQDFPGEMQIKDGILIVTGTTENIN
jgi:hypothetical protein